MHKRCWHTEAGIQRQKKKENAMMLFLQQHFTVDREVQMNYSCFESGKRFARLDGVIYLPGLTVIVECDEHQHKDSNYTVSCDVARMNFVNTAHVCSGNGSKLLWLRVNPDEFKVDGRSVKIHKREKFGRVVEIIRHFELHGLQKDIGVMYLFYDTVGNKPAILDDVDYSDDFKPFVLDSCLNTH
jgi:hypothetical protein